MRGESCDAFESSYNGERNNHYALSELQQEGVCMIEIHDGYTGYLTLFQDDPRVAAIYDNPTVNTFSLLENQYLAVLDGET